MNGPMAGVAGGELAAVSDPSLVDTTVLSLNSIPTLSTPTISTSTAHCAALSPPRVLDADLNCTPQAVARGGGMPFIAAGMHSFTTID